MAHLKTYEQVAEHENEEYIASRPEWKLGVGRVPTLDDYMKISCDDMEEAVKLATYGAALTDLIMPGQKLFFTQALLVGAIANPGEKYRSIMMVCPSRYGKSMLTGIAGIIQATQFDAEVRIGGATRDKADLVMEKIVQHLPKTSKDVQDGMVIGEDDKTINRKIARLSTQTSREALSWKTGGSIKLFTLNETSKSSDIAGQGVIGVGGDVMILDETQLISNKNYFTARRFFAQSSHTKLVELGNPMRLGHFKDVYDDPSTFVIHMNDVTSIIEGRMTRKDFELTMIPKHTLEYKAFVQCLFPDENSSDGFFPTLPAPSRNLKGRVPTEKISFLGIDSAYKGADGLVVSVVSLCRADDRAWIQLEYQTDLKAKYPQWTKDTTLNVALDILKIKKEYNCFAGAIDIAFGIHIFEMINSLDPNFPLDPVNFGNKPTESRKGIHYSATWAYNLRAEMHLDVKEFCEGEFLYLNDEYYDELIREMREIHAENELGKIKVENKSKIKGRLGRSPDCLDSVCLAIRALVMSGFLGSRVGEGSEVLYID